jgi:hypothetical protein
MCVVPLLRQQCAYNMCCIFDYLCTIHKYVLRMHMNGIWYSQLRLVTLLCSCTIFPGSVTAVLPAFSYIYNFLTNIRLSTFIHLKYIIVAGHYIPVSIKKMHKKSTEAALIVITHASHGNQACTLNYHAVYAYVLPTVVVCMTTQYTYSVF